MFKVGKQVETALIALKELESSKNSDSGASIASISNKHNLSKNTLSKVFQTLSNKGALTSVQGVKGGYKLSRPLNALTLFELLEALGEVKPLGCQTEFGCELEQTCNIKSPLKRWEKKFEEFLKSTMVSELVHTSKTLPNTSRSIKL